MIWTLKKLLESANEVQTEINGKYVPARPMALDGLCGLKSRIVAAIAVLSGKADAFVWPEGQ